MLKLRIGPIPLLALCGSIVSLWGMVTGGCTITPETTVRTDEIFRGTVAIESTSDRQPEVEGAEQQRLSTRRDPSDARPLRESNSADHALGTPHAVLIGPSQESALEVVRLPAIADHARTPRTGTVPSADWDPLLTLRGCVDASDHTRLALVEFPDGEVRVLHVGDVVEVRRANGELSVGRVQQINPTSIAIRTLSGQELVAK